MRVHLAAVTLISVGLTTALISGCTIVGPDYTAPETKTDSQWHAPDSASEQITSAEPVATEWWQLLREPLLNRYIAAAADGNLDIQIAASRIRQARVVREIERAAYSPQVSGYGAVTVEDLSEHGRIAGSVPSLPGGSGIKTNRDIYDARFDASWELDLFGRTYRAVEAADAHIDAAIEARRHILLTVLAEVSRNYLSLRGIQRQMAVLERQIELQRETLKIVQQRYRAGAASQFDVEQANARLRTSEAGLPNLTSEIRAYAYQLAVLLGREPQSILADVIDTKPLPVPPDVVPVGLRSDILRRRPDIRTAERHLAAATAEIGVAVADLFPRFSLTGSTGLESLSFGDLFQSGSTFRALGPNIRWPILQGGRLHARVKLEELQAETAMQQYEQSVLNALRDSETALVRYGQELQTRRRMERAVDINQRAVALAHERYQSGEDDLLSVISAQHQLAAAEMEQVRSETRSVLNLISLYKALGGGWEVFED